MSEFVECFLILSDFILWLSLMSSTTRPISLYIHIPFCEYKCTYCSFFVIAKERGGAMIQQLQHNFLQALYAEIRSWKEALREYHIMTIHIGWWTPSTLGVEWLSGIIDLMMEVYDMTQLRELTIELNPDPLDDMVYLIDSLSSRYHQIPVMRYSMGIQSVDDETLALTARQYRWSELMWFFDQLWQIKHPHMRYNADLMVFWESETHRYHPERIREVLSLPVWDSVSLYTLEITQGSLRYQQQYRYPEASQRWWHTQQMEYQRQDMIRMLWEAGFDRYELSNFHRQGRWSLHNQQYWTMGQYIWLWPSAHSFVSDEILCRKLASHSGIDYHMWAGVRWGVTTKMREYIAHQSLDQQTIVWLSDTDKLIEGFFLRMRTSAWVQHLDQYSSVLVDQYVSLIQQYVSDDFVVYDNHSLYLTDQWFAVYNTLIASLLRQV